MGKGAGGMKRTDTEKEYRNEASRMFYAEEVCWALTIAANIGLDAQQALAYAAEDFDKWSSFVDWTHGKKDNENG